MADFFVSHSGNDNNDGSDNSANSFRSINRGVAALGPDDTLKLVSDENYVHSKSFSGNATNVIWNANAVAVQKVGEFTEDASEYEGKYLFFAHDALTGYDNGGFLFLSKTSDDQLVFSAVGREFTDDAGIDYQICIDQPQLMNYLGNPNGDPEANVWLTAKSEDPTDKATVYTEDTFFDGSPNSSLFDVQSDNWRIRDIIFTDATPTDVVYCISANDNTKKGLTVTGCEMNDVHTGVHVGGQENALVYYNKITLGTDVSHNVGVVLGGNSGVAFGNDIKGNTVTGFIQFTFGILVNAPAKGCVVVGNYIHDFHETDSRTDWGVAGIGVSGSAALIANNVIYNIITDNMTVKHKYAGILLWDNTGIGKGKIDICVNNIIHTCEYGIQRLEADDDEVGSIGYSDFNCIFNSRVADYRGVDPGPNDVNADPLFSDIANDDFTLQPASPCLNTGFPMGGADTGGFTSMGAWQRLSLLGDR